MLIAHNTLGDMRGALIINGSAPRGNGSEERATAAAEAAVAINSKTGTGQQSTAKQVKDRKTGDSSDGSVD